MINRFMIFVRNTVIILLSLIVIYSLLVSLAFAIPDSKIAAQADASIALIDNEGEGYYPLNFSFEGARLDNFTDWVMIDATRVTDQEYSVIENAMVPSYARYWHGYQIVIRPLLTFMGYDGIRYFNMFIFFILIAFLFKLLCKKISALVAVAFMVSILAGFAIIIPMSIQFSVVSYLTFFYMIFILLCFDWIESRQTAVYVFLCFGSFVSFFDLLSTPLLALGIPLMLYLILKYKNGSTIKTNIFDTIKLSAMWSFGYLATWGSKWLIGSWILKQDVVKEALDALLFRSLGSEEVPLNRFETLKQNYNLYFNSKIEMVLLIMLVIWLVAFIFFRKPIKKTLPIVIPTILIMAYPYVWYLILSNHSQIHLWFSYRLQAVTMFALISGLSLMIDYESLVRWVKSKRRVNKSQSNNV